jgi:CHRD domain
MRHTDNCDKGLQAGNGGALQTIRAAAVAIWAVAAVVTAPIPTQAATLSFVAELGNFENPPTGSAGTGVAFLDYDDVTHMMSVRAYFSGLTGNTTVAHIHCCVAVPNGNVGVASTTPTFPGFPAGVTAGSYSRIFDLTLASSFNPAFVTASIGGTVAAAEARLLAGLLNGGAYFNIHTTQFAGGEIRGFIYETPIPGALLLFSTGLSLLGLLGWRRKRKHTAAIAAA